MCLSVYMFANGRSYVECEMGVENPLSDEL